MNATGIRTWWREGHLLVGRWTHNDRGELTWVAHAANAYHRWTRWVRPSWWMGYVFAPYDSTWRWPWGKKGRYYTPQRRRVPWRTVIWCRLRGHPAGAIWWNPGGLEPDGRCADCLETIE